MTTDRGEGYGLVKGFLLAHAASQEVLEALARLEPPRPEACGLIELGPRPPLITPQETEALLRPEPPPEKKRKPANLTPEQRAAIGARLKAGREAKAASNASLARAPDPGEALPPF